MAKPAPITTIDQFKAEYRAGIGHVLPAGCRPSRKRTLRRAVAGLLAGLLALYLGVAAAGHIHADEPDHCAVCLAGSGAAAATAPTPPAQPVCVSDLAPGSPAPAVLAKASVCHPARGPPLSN